MGRFVVEMDGAYFLSLLCAIFILGMFFTGRFFPPEENACELSQNLVNGQFTLTTVDNIDPPIFNANNLIEEEKQLEIIDANI